MRKFRMFLIADEEKKSHYAVSHIHNEAGFRELRAALALSYDVGRIEPDIQVADADMRGDRCLQVQHMAHDHIPLEAKDRSEVLKYIRTLWGYNVSMESIDRSSGSVMQKVLLTDKGEEDLCAKKLPKLWAKFGRDESAGPPLRDKDDDVAIRKFGQEAREKMARAMRGLQVQKDTSRKPED